MKTLTQPIKTRRKLEVALDILEAYINNSDAKEDPWDGKLGAEELKQARKALAVLYPTNARIADLKSGIITITGDDHSKEAK